MKIINKRAVISITAVLVIMLTVVLIRQHIMITERCNITYHTVGMGDDNYVLHDGCRISVTGASMWEEYGYYDKLGPEYSSYVNYITTMPSNIESYVIELTVHVERIEEGTTDGCGIWCFHMLQDAALIGYDMPLETAMNPDIDYLTDIKVGESYDFTVPYFMYADGFTDKQWDNKLSLDYELVTDIYPEHNSISIDNIEDCTDYEYTVSTEQAVAMEAETDSSTENEDKDSSDNRINSFDTDGMNLYEADTEVKMGELAFKLDSAGYISNKEDIDSMPDTGNLVDFAYGESVAECFDSQDGEYISGSGKCFIMYTYTITNNGSEDTAVCNGNIFLTDGIINSTQGSGQLIYSSEPLLEYDNGHQAQAVVVPAGGNVTVTAVEYFSGYDNGGMEDTYLKIIYAAYDPVTLDETTPGEWYGCYIDVETVE